MELITTQIDIDAPAAEVARALTTTEGHRGWWTRDCEIGGLGERAQVRFKTDSGTREMVFRIDRQDEHGIEWTCVDERNNPGWRGTRVAVRLAPKGKATYVELLHSHWKEKGQTYEMCVGGWRYFMQSLKTYCETGKGTPHGSSTVE